MREFNIYCKFSSNYLFFKVAEGKKEVPPYDNYISVDESCRPALDGLWTWWREAQPNISKAPIKFYFWQLAFLASPLRSL